VERYLTLKYPMEIVEDDGGWAVSVPDLPGCNSFGTTPEDAIRNIQEAKELWIKSQAQSGGEIPEPTNEDDFSGKFVLRIPRALHRSLAYQAKTQGISLNQYAGCLLSERNPLHIVQNTLKRLLSFRQDLQAMWIHDHETPRRKYILMGAQYAGDISAVTLLSKPATKGKMKVPRTLEEQYRST
jgi:antitoxin HicB